MQLMMDTRQVEPQYLREFAEKRILMEIRSIPVDVARFSGWVVVVEPCLRVSAETGQPVLDRDDQKVWRIGVAIVKDGTREGEVVDIAVQQDLSGIAQDTIIEVDNLEATPWVFNGRTGIAWRASSIKVVERPPASRVDVGHSTTAPGRSAPARTKRASARESKG